MIAYFIFFEKANVPSIRPVLDRLLSHSWIKPFFVKGFDYKEYTGTISPLVVPPEIPQDDIHRYFPASIQIDASDYIETLSEKTDDTALSPENSILEDLYHNILRREYMPFLLEQFFCIKFALERFIKEKSPRLVILPEDTDFLKGRLAARVMKHFGITTVVILPTYYNSIIQYPLLGERLADFYFVMNENTMRSLLEQGVSADKILLCGSPFFEKPPKPRVETRPRRFLYVLQNKEWETLILADLAQIFAQRDDLELLVKNHPESSRESLQATFPEQKNVRWITHGSLEDLWGELHCVIGQTSIALYEAVAQNLPIIVVNYSGLPLEIFIPEELEKTLVAKDAGALARKIEEAAAGFLPPVDPSPFLYSPSGATDAILAQLEKLAAGLPSP